MDAPKLPYVKGCCCCFDLSTGAIIIGGMSLFGAIVGVFSLLSLLLSLLDAAAASEKNTEILWGIWVLILGVIILVAITSGMLINGANKRRKGLVYPYLVTTGFYILLDLLFVPYKLQAAAETNNPKAMPLFMGNIIFLALDIYFWICVYSFYIELREQEKTNNSQPEANVTLPILNHPNVTYGQVAN